MGWERGMSPPATLRFFTFQVLNGAILALFLHFFTFSTEKVGIVGAFWKSRKKVGTLLKKYEN